MGSEAGEDQKKKKENLGQSNTMVLKKSPTEKTGKISRIEISGEALHSMLIGTAPDDDEPNFWGYRA